MLASTHSSQRVKDRLVALANMLKPPVATAPSLETATKPFPVENPTLSFWRTEPHGLENYRSTSNLPEACDVLIIGAGFSGASTAYHLLDNNPSPPSMVILEARSVCSGATGRNGE